MNNFLIAAFRREMDSFPIEYKIIKDRWGRYILEYYNLPTELDFHLIRATYEKNVIIGKEKSILGSFDKVYHGYEKICTPITNKDNKIIQIELDDDYYATKINAVSHIMRNFFHTSY